VQLAAKTSLQRKTAPKLFVPEADNDVAANKSAHRSVLVPASFEPTQSQKKCCFDFHLEGDWRSDI